MLYILKRLTKFGVALRSFYENQNSVQDQDEDQDHDFTLDFNPRPTVHIKKTPIKFGLDPLTPLKLIVSTVRIHVRTYSQTTRQTDRQTEFFLPVLFSNCKIHKNKHSSKGENFFFNHARREITGGVHMEFTKCYTHVK